MSKKAIIAGGGIGGLFVALLLGKEGWETVNLEKRTVNSQGGSMLGLWPNATRLLAEAGLMDALLKRGVQSRAMRLYNWQDEHLNTLQVGNTEAASLQIARGELHGILVKSLPEQSIKLNSGVRSFEESAAGVRVETTGGEVMEANILIGADGIHSKVRELLQGESPAVYRGYRAFYGRVGSDVQGLEGFEPGHVDYIWGRGKRAVVYPYADGRIAWTVFVNGTQEEWKDSGAENEILLSRIGDGPERLQKLVEASPEPGQADICDRMPARLWGRGPVTLLGDAAHATTPELAQGACMALEDGAMLTKLLTEMKQPERAFREYESRRFNRTSLVTLGSLVTGGLLASENPVLSSLRETATKLFPADLVSGLFNGVMDNFFKFKIK